MGEHRAAPRHRVLKAGTIEFSGTKIDCLVRNISATGASIEVKSPLWFPNTFVLSIATDDITRGRHIIWRKERRLGVVFND